MKWSSVEEDCPCCRQLGAPGVCSPPYLAHPHLAANLPWAPIPPWLFLLPPNWKEQLQPSSYHGFGIHVVWCWSDPAQAGPWAHTVGSQKYLRCRILLARVSVCVFVCLPRHLYLGYMELHVWVYNIQINTNVSKFCIFPSQSHLWLTVQDIKAHQSLSLSF